ncbi:MAG: hypothetical protein PHS62_00240 [Patescibacteria group bacterium]|nr:hypothetical protein [Patescibacteria group bacterium]
MPEIYNPKKETQKIKQGIEVSPQGYHLTEKDTQEKKKGAKQEEWREQK